MDNAPLCQLVYHRNYLGRSFAGSRFVRKGFQFADGVTSGFAVIAVPFAALGGLAYVFLGCFVIGHVVKFRTAKVRENGLKTGIAAALA